MVELVEKFFGYNDDDVFEVRKVYGKCERDVLEDVGVVREWLRKQPHLPQDIDDAVLERFLLKNKFRIEVTKEKLDLHYTTKSHHKDFLESVDPLSESLKSQMDFQIVTVLPKLTPAKERLWVARWYGGDRDYHFDRAIQTWALCLEVQLRYDYNISDRVILDMDGFGWNQYKTLTPACMARCVHLLQEGYSARVAGLELVHPTPFISSLMTLMKLIFKPKLYSRIRVHKDEESLRNAIPVDCLPKEYGGTLGSVMDLNDEFRRILVSERSWLLSGLRKCSDETLRIGESKYGSVNVFGVDGTFKKLQVD